MVILMHVFSCGSPFLFPKFNILHGQFYSTALNKRILELTTNISLWTQNYKFIMCFFLPIK
jgi:hypothetical protein